MTDRIDGSGQIPPQQPASSQPADKATGTLGDKTVKSHDIEGRLLKGQEISDHPARALSDYSVKPATALSADNIDMIRNLLNNGQWDGARSALNRHVQSLDQFDQLSAALPKNLPTEGMQVVTNCYGTLAAQRITENLTDLEGTPQERLDCLNFYFVQPHSPHNAVRTVVRAVANDFMQSSSYASSKQSLTDQMETSVFLQLHRHAESLDQQVISEGDAQATKLVEQQARQRRIEIGA